MFLVDLRYVNKSFKFYSKLAISLMLHRDLERTLSLVDRDNYILRQNVVILLLVYSPGAEIVVSSPRPSSVLV